MWRYELITKEEMDNFCKGEMKLKDSVNDDLESLFENIQLGKEPDDYVKTYFLPKFTEEEMELVESDSKYVHGLSRRRTFVIENSFENFPELLNETSSRIPSENSFENVSEKQSCFKTCCNCSLQ